MQSHLRRCSCAQIADPTSFHPKSFSEVNPEHRSEHSAWETPDPGFWTKHGYAIVRADERGTGQSRGKLDTMSRETSEAFFDVIEWAAEQPWSTGKIGLLGISYYAGSQWRVAARQPKGLACIIPWEGMSDYYRDRCRHGGILSNSFIKFWWDRQVVSNQYGRPGRAARHWGPDTIEGDLPEEELVANRQDQTIDNAENYFRDDIYYASKLLTTEHWSPVYTLSTTLTAIHQLLTDPRPDSPLNVDVAALLRDGDIPAWESIVRYWTEEERWQGQGTASR